MFINVIVYRMCMYFGLLYNTLRINTLTTVKSVHGLTQIQKYQLDVDVVFL